MEPSGTWNRNTGKEKERGLFGRALFCGRELFRRFGNDFLAVVGSAVRAYTERRVHLAAFGAFHETWRRQFPSAGTAGISAGLGCFFLGYCHGEHLLILTRTAHSNNYSGRKSGTKAAL